MSTSKDYERRQTPEAATTGDLGASPSADEEPGINRANHPLSRFIAEGFRRDSPGRCAFPVERARQFGISDGQIVSRMAANAGFDLTAARQNGYSNEQIIDFLARGDEMPGDDSELAGESGASAEASDELVTAGQEAASAEELNQSREQATLITPEPTSQAEGTALSESVPTSGVMPEARALVRRNLDVSLTHLPEEMKLGKRWGLWRFEIVWNQDGSHRLEKVPCVAQLTGAQHAASDDPNSWCTFAKASATLKADWARWNGGTFDGFSFYFLNSGFTGIDLDNVLNDDGTIAPWAELLLTELRGTYIEVSVRGRGLHIMVRGTFKGGGIKEKFSDATGFEMYPDTKGRYFTVSGKPWNSAPSVIAEVDCQSLADRFRRGEIGPPDYRAAKAAKEAKASASSRVHDNKSSEQAFDVAGFLERHPIALTTPEPYNGGTLWLIECHGTHEGYPRNDGKAYLVQHASGAVSAGCQHKNHCSWSSGNHWKELREHYEPKTKLAKTPPAQANDDEWPEPQPLGGELPAVPAFDLKMLPEAFRPLVEDTALRMQVPPECPAVVSIVCLSAATGSRAVIQPKRLDTSWKVVPTLWGDLVAPSGFMKTPIMSAILAPIYEIEALWRQEYKGVMVEYEHQKKEADLRLAEWEKAYRLVYRRNEYTSTNKKSTLPPRPDDMPVAPPCRRLLVNDATYEKLHVILSENGGGVLAFRDELVGWISQLDSVGREADRAFFLQSWSKVPHIVDRIGRGTTNSEAPILMLGGITPRNLRRYLTEANENGQLDDGLLQRFQITVYPDQQNWKYVDRDPNHTAMAQAKAAYERLLALDITRPLQYAFDDAAQELFVEWLTELEAKVRDGTLHPALVSHLSKYRSLMPSLAVLFELADNRQHEATVSLAHTQQAAEWCSYLESHARRIYSLVISPQLRAAAELGRRLEEGWKRQEGMFTAREVYLNGWSGLDTAEKVRLAVEILIDANWIRTVDPGKSTAGRPSEIYAISPRLKEVRRCQVSG